MQSNKRLSQFSPALLCLAVLFATLALSGCGADVASTAATQAARQKAAAKSAQDNLKAVTTSMEAISGQKSPDGSPPFQALSNAATAAASADKDTAMKAAEEQAR